MARLARVVAPGYPHHVTQRGNRGQDAFFCEDDYRAYLDLLVEWCGKHEVRIWAYCLMPNLPAAGRPCASDRCPADSRRPVSGHRGGASPLHPACHSATVGEGIREFQLSILSPELRRHDGRQLILERIKLSPRFK